MTRKRRRSIDESSDSYMRKSRSHKDFTEIFRTNNVVDLKERVRKTGNKDWYLLRKNNLVSSCIVHDCSVRITQFFRGIVEAKLDRFLKHQESDSVCPISLNPISELRSPYVHDGNVFSRDDLVQYFLASFNFCNPITRKELKLGDVKRLGSEELVRVYGNRESLRKESVDNINHFAFLEMEFEELFLSMVSLYHERWASEYITYYKSFHETWSQMMAIDKNRTMCTVKSLHLKSSALKWHIRAWAKKIVDSYVRITSSPET